MAKNNFAQSGFGDSLKNDEIDMRYGFKRVSDNIRRVGYLINMHSTELLDEDRRVVSALDLFLIQMDGTRFKYTVSFLPYFLICTYEDHDLEVTQYLKNKFGAEITNIEKVCKEDLDLPNHLSGLKQTYLKIMFHNQNSLAKVRKIVLTAVNKNTERFKKNDEFEKLLSARYPISNDLLIKNAKAVEPLDFVMDIREHDVPYHVRVSIDLKIFCGMWYSIEIVGKDKTLPEIKPMPDILERPEPVVLAFDIETTKLPLKFPDAQTDQVIMISYMIDGQGYLITNREIISVDVNDFEYTPKPEFEGHFIVYNEANEMQTIQKFFDHIMEVRPHIFVTYNGDFFDWPFIETRASLHGLSMNDEIGFSKSREGVYLSRPAIHMDCLCWVKRDSYLPVGSQGLKAVAKAKLRYDPIELDPEEMCKMAREQPQVLSNYSVSDAIATFYLYMKYVHPFIFALNTIIPMEPDEILRKGSGTLCETLLMVEAYHANIVFPNKQQSEATKFSSDGRLIDAETYVGGHVEALECGVFRADIPYRFRLDRNMVTQLIQSTDKVLEHAIVAEEGVPMEQVNNFEDVSNEIKRALQGLHDIPNRVEQPVIYHLDVGAMYPNIILTNRLQPSAIVNDADCAACDFNYPDAKCKRTMKWQWRGDMLPATKNELQRIKQQLEMEKFPPLQVGGSQRAFHELSKEDQTTYEKKRLTDYCRKVYKKTKIVKLEERASTICQKENSFYVDTVRAFRDRRYDYKGLTKVAKKAVVEAQKNGDVAEIKAAKNKEILYDSLQLAHKCILNSFYGYVMRKGARWHSMPMAGIVCLTGSNIITQARIIIERIGRPLELDTDGIWCILPASFPQVFTINSTHKKGSFNISYPNAILNNMVKDHFTNDQYHELVRSEDQIPKYQIRSENSIFFEVDGPYLAMVLPAAKEEGKKLKKRYAVFNFDGSLAELKGFEVKRRGELQLIKNFQSSVFESFLSGNTLEECYANVAKIANYWLDVLYSQGQNLPDSELFELISENRSMSKKLEDYGAQKSTSISTAKRLAEFLGDQMVKDAGLACKYVISKKPEGSPVTERAVPLAIFQCEPSIRRYYLRRWLRDNSMGDADIRDVVDWGYYIERLSGAIQKIITIPAAMQGLNNPVPRVLHPDWLHRRMMASTDKLKQRQITELFAAAKPKENQNFELNDMVMDKRVMTEDSATEIAAKSPVASKKNTATKRKCPRDDTQRNSWKQALGSPPPIGTTKKEIIKWVSFQKEKWAFQLNQKKENRRNFKKPRHDNNGEVQRMKSFTMREFIRQSKHSLLDQLWQVIHLSAIDNTGNFIVWAIVKDELHKVKLNMPRIFYVNQRTESDTEANFVRKKVHCVLPRAAQPYHIYKYKFQEQSFKCNGLSLIGSLPMADIEGVYETKISLESRFLIDIGCLCRISRSETDARSKASDGAEVDTYSFEQLTKSADTNIYLEKSWQILKKIFLYQHNSLGKRQIWGLYMPSSKRVVVAVLDTVRTNEMPNLNLLYASERAAFLKNIAGDNENTMLPESMVFETFIEVDLLQVYRHLQRALSKYKEDKRGPTLLCTQTTVDTTNLKSVVPSLADFPNIKIHIADDTSTLHGLNWQRQTTRSMMRHFLNFNSVVNLMLEQSRYLHIPIGNVPADPVLVGTDIFYARLLQKNNFLLWWSTTNRPDLGGKEAEDYKLLTEVNSNVSITQNNSGFYGGICVSLTVQNLAVSALLHSSKIHEMSGGHSATAFDNTSKATIDEMLVPGAQVNTNEFGSCSPAFRILRNMVNGWLREVSLNQNAFSDYHIAHFYRWVRSSNSFMYDPAICKVLTNLMENLLLGIIAEFKRLGVVIIFADFNRIIISSKKKTIIDALSYVEFIVQSIRKKELYHSVQLSFDQSWNNLIWIDAANFAGVKGVLPSLDDDESCKVIEEDASSTLEVNFALESEISTEDEFKEKFEVFASMLLQSLLEKESFNDAIRNISQKIFGLAIELHRKYSNEDQASVLKFVQAVIKIASINDDTSDEVISLRRNLLKIIGVNEFSEDDNFLASKDFVLNAATCKACNDYRDISLLSDKHQAVRNGSKVWLCNRCLVAYDNNDIEVSIIRDITSRITNYVLQDVQCSQCHDVKKDNFSQVCNCGGRYVPLTTKYDIKDKINPLLKLAKSHQMDMLHHILLKILN